MLEFMNFLAARVFAKPDKAFFEEENFNAALELTIKDVQYHFPHVSREEVEERITGNQNELAIFLYRLGNLLYKKNPAGSSLRAIHFLMKDLCACELYYSTEIEEGFYIFHGTGTVIGSRNKIGKGFKIYQNCTIGHRTQSARGNIIGDNVVCYAGAKILGENEIGNNAVIGANTLVTKNIPENFIAYGNPLVLKEKNIISNIL